ncbi:MAG: ComEC/Rec2 family competence protein [Clostridiales bacterium]|nr:ComEC/Rec2 family competence protein [Clostridiales bacterium]
MNTKDKRKKYINIRPVLFTAFSLILGILFAYFLIKNSLVSYLLLFLTFFALIFSIFYFRKTPDCIRIIKCTIYMTIAFIIGLTSFNAILENYNNANIKEDNYIVQGEIQKVSSTTEGNFYYVIDNVKFLLDDKVIENSFNFSFYYPEELELGDEVSFEAYVKNYDAFYNGNFSINKVQKNVKYYTYNVKNLVVTGKSPTIFQKANSLIKDVLKENLTEETFGVSFALMTGDSNFIEDDLLQNYRNAGIAHIFAVSGLHIGFLCAILSFILNKLRVKRLIQFFIILPVLIFYSGICSFMPSSLRAVIMCSVALLMRCFGEKYDVITSISFSAIIVLLIRPLDLFNVGFQLSYLSCFGIVLLNRPILKVLKFLPKKVASGLATTFSAQIATLPLLLTYFNQVSLVASLFNLLLIPVVFILFSFLFFAIFITLIFPFLGFVFFPIKYLILGINYLINFFDYNSLLLTEIAIGGFSFIYYFIILIVSGFINFAKITKIVLSIFLSMIFIIGTLGLTLYERGAVDMNVGSSKGIYSTLFMGKEDNLVVNKIGKEYNDSLYLDFIDKLKDNKIENLIIATEDNFTTFVVNLSKIVKIDNVYYYGGKNSMYESLLLNTNFINCSTLENNLKEATFSFLNKGFAVDYKTRENTFLLVSEMEGKNYFINLKEKRDFIILSDGVDFIDANAVKKEIICYKKSEKVLNTGYGKNIFFKINKYGVK